MDVVDTVITGASDTATDELQIQVSDGEDVL